MSRIRGPIGAAITALLILGVVSVFIYVAYLALSWIGVIAWIGEAIWTIATVLSIMGIIFGAYWIDRAVVNEEKSRHGTHNRLLLVLRAAIVLSAVSFSTTLFGMLNFVSGSIVDIGDGLFGWFVSLGTTFGVQFIMLIVSLILGERLIGLRPRPDDAFHQYNLGNAGPEWSGAPNLQPYVWGGVAIALLTLAAYLFGLITRSDIEGAWSSSVNQGAGSVPLGILALLLALLALRKARVIRNLWNLITLSFLLFVYGGTLFVSSLFSFDSYYGIFLSDEDVAQRRGSIIREETNRMRREALSSFDTYQTSLKSSERASAFQDQVQKGIDALQQGARGLEIQLREDAQKADVRRREENARIEQQIRDAEARRDEAKGRALSRLQDRSALEDALTKREAELSTIQSTLDGLIKDRNEIIADIKQKRLLAECEKNGDNTGPCAGASGIKDCGSRCEGYLTDAKWLETNKLVDTERLVTQKQDELRQKSADVARERTRLQALGAATATDDPLAASIRVEVAEIEKSFAEEIAALRSQIRREPVAAQAGIGSVSGLSERFATFLAEPSGPTLAAFSDYCRTVRESLIRVGVKDDAVVGFDCRPPAMEAQARDYERLITARAEYQRECGRDLDANPQASSGANDLDSLRAIVDETRRCMQIANLGQDEVLDATKDITELESTYLVASSSMRRAINDARRGNAYAVGAAGGAVFIDVLILVVGMLVAWTRPSVFYDDPLNPDIPKLEEALTLAAAAYSPDGEAPTGMRIFTRYLEDRDITLESKENPREAQHFRTTFNERAVPPEYRELTNAILTTIPPRYKRHDVGFSAPSWVDPNAAETQFREKRVAISLMVVNLMRTLANQSSAPPKESAPYTDNDAEFARNWREKRRRGGRRPADSEPAKPRAQRQRPEE